MGPFKMTEVRQARFPHLFEPIALSGRRLRNRIVALSTVTNFNRGGHVTKDYVAYLSARAAGGAAKREKSRPWYARPTLPGGARTAR